MLALRAKAIGSLSTIVHFAEPGSHLLLPELTGAALRLSSVTGCHDTPVALERRRQTAGVVPKIRTKSTSTAFRLSASLGADLSIRSELFRRRLFRPTIPASQNYCRPTPSQQPD